jgi:hypothetical protein
MHRPGYAKDKFQNSDHFPPVLHFHEGGVMVGSYVMIRDDIFSRWLGKRGFTPARTGFFWRVQTV